VKRICQDLEHRCLPLLIDMGGRPKDSQINMLRHCTHAVLLLRTDEPDCTQLWQRLVTESDLLLLAQIHSQLEGISTITAHAPILEGTLTGLERYITTLLTGPVFDALVERIVALFNSYSLQDLEKAKLEQAPTKLVINLYDALYALDPLATKWESEMLKPFLASVPTNTPLSVYGMGSNWIYAALAAHTDHQSLYQFDPKLPFGWIQPLALQLSSERFPEMLVKPYPYDDVTRLSISFPSHRLEYFQPLPLPFPPVRTDVGLIIDGPLPYWLLTALVRLYKEVDVVWIAVYYPQFTMAVALYSCVETYLPADRISLPAHQVYTAIILTYVEENVYSIGRSGYTVDNELM
jgi:CRISPR-associated protein Csx3